MKSKTIKHLVRQALLQNSDYKEWVLNLKRILKEYHDEHYLDTFYMDVWLSIKFNAEAHRDDAHEETWYCEIKKYQSEFIKSLNLTVSPSYTKDYLDNFLDNFSNIIIDKIIERYEFCHNWESVHKLSCSNVNTGFTKIIGWSSYEVGIYYVEQECGEHWIMLPKNPSFATEQIIIRQKEGFEEIKDDKEPSSIKRLRKRLNNLD